MKSFLTLIVLAILISQSLNAQVSKRNLISISPTLLKDKIAGGWAGKMIGVTYGAPTEFHALGRTFEDSINWKPSDIIGSMWQDDIYVQLTFMMTMDKYGVNAPAKKFQEMFAKAGYMLWHANVQARKNYYDSIFPPASGSPLYNGHADDIDFQIEADYLGFMCPGMPVTLSQMANKIGHIMNYGDGVYGGIFLSALYTQAFFENNIATIISNSLKTIPAESNYAKMIAEVINLHKQYPDNWRKSWKILQEKWGDNHFCTAGDQFNIDAKLNGAYVVLGLLYGEGDIMKTLEITTRCGQDSDCNPCNAMAVLGVIYGFNRLPSNMKEAVHAVADSLFINTNYSFNKAVENTYKYALDIIKTNGGKINNSLISIASQQPAPVPLEVSFPNTIFNKAIPFNDTTFWRFSGNWKPLYKYVNQNKKIEQSLFSANKKDIAEINFTGTGIAIEGNWLKDGGKFDVFVDEKFNRTVDTYYFYNKQEHENIVLWHINGLKNTHHKIKIVVKGEKKPESSGQTIYITKALLFSAN